MVVGGTAALIVANPHVASYFRDPAGNLDNFIDSFASPITSAETAAVPLALMVSGYIRHKPYDVNNAMLAGEAYLNGAVVDAVMKGLRAGKDRLKSGRVSPSMTRSPIRTSRLSAVAVFLRDIRLVHLQSPQPFPIATGNIAGFPMPCSA